MLHGTDGGSRVCCMGLNMHYHFIRGRREAREEILVQSKTTPQEANSKSQRSMPGVRRWLDGSSVWLS